MKNFKLTKRRVAGLAVVLAIASLGIFAGTYAKYVSTVDLGNKPDQNAQVAVWHVGEPVSIGNLFSPYYYNASYKRDEKNKDDLGNPNSGHDDYDSSNDTVFRANEPETDNLIAPGTKGEKSFRIQDNVKSDGETPVGSGNTEVSYIVTFPKLDGSDSRVTFTGDTGESNDYLKTHLKFKLSIDGTEKTADWVNGDGLNDALDDVELRYDSAGLDALVKIEWEWPFDDGDEKTDLSDVAAAVAQTTVAVNFGTVRYEQVDDNQNPVTPDVSAGSIYDFAGTSWRVLKVENNQALILKVDALTGVESGTSDSTSAVSIPFLSATAVSKSGSGSELGLSAGSTDGYRGYYFFDSDGSNGYEDSGAASYTDSNDLKYKYGLKGAIDYYYNHSLKAYENSILAVDLHDPTLEQFKTGVDSLKDATYNLYVNGDKGGEIGWSDCSKDIRFATTVGTGDGFKQQAFALSYGDIHTTMGISVELSNSDWLSFTTNNSFWLRSAANMPTQASAVLGGNFNSYSVVNGNEHVRPALWVKLS